MKEQTFEDYQYYHREWEREEEHQRLVTIYDALENPNNYILIIVPHLNVGAADAYLIHTDYEWHLSVVDAFDLRKMTLGGPDCRSKIRHHISDRFRVNNSLRDLKIIIL